MPVQHRAPRHAAPRDLSRSRAAVLPGVLMAVVGTAFAGLAAMPASAAGTPAGTGRLSAVAMAGQQQAAGLSSAGAGRPAAAGDEAAPRTEQPEVELEVVQQQVNVALGTALAQGLEVANRPPPPPPAPARASRSRTDPVTGEQVSFARPGTGRLTSQYGRRWGRLHAGIDLAAGVGAPIFAVMDGTVMSAGAEGGYGRAIRLLHDDGTVSVYGHLSQLLVGDGERVGAGEQIAEEGNTGQSTGPHLHFEIRIEGAPVDPRAWLRERGVDL